MTQTMTLAAEEQIMSRFSRVTGSQFRVWSPPESALRIEYGPKLLSEARSQRSSGILYGLVANDAVRVVAARPNPSMRDPLLAGLSPVGIFSTRERGEIFLTEEDLTRFEELNARVALIIVGNSAGFFVREKDGSIQSIRSHREIPCAAIPRRRRRWIPHALLAVLALALSPMLPRPKLALSVRNDGDQLRISWNRVDGSIEIRDGSIVRRMAVTPALSSITYSPETGDVQMRLTNGRRVETLRVIGADPQPSEADRLRAQIVDLETQASNLALEFAAGSERAAELQRTLSKIKRAD